VSGDLDRQLGQLEEMASDELKSRWRALTGTPVPKVSPSLMRLALAWELQARACGGLSRRTSQKLDQLAAGKTRTADAVPGMRLVREWNGTVHVVEVGEDGAIRWNGQSWKSLSEVAREITGTRWSGPAFFGLKRKAAA
jgi:hypothetical protein